MAMSQLVRDPPVGAILWIKKLSSSDVQETHGLPPDYFMHPCVVLHVSVSRRDFVHIYVVRSSRSPWKPPGLRCPRSTHDSGEQITSKSGRNINDHPLPAPIRRQHVPIYPKPFNNLLPDLQLRLERNVELRKESYVNTQKVYTLPLSLLERYNRRRPVKDFCFDEASVRWLRHKAFGEPFLDTEVQLRSASTLVNTYNTFQPTPPHGTALQHTGMPPPNAVVPPARIQPNLGSSRSSSSRRVTAPPPSRPSHNRDEALVLVACALVVLATVASVVLGIVLLL
jgi:hypothetical protein